MLGRRCVQGRRAATPEVGSGHSSPKHISSVVTTTGSTDEGRESDPDGPVVGGTPVPPRQGRTRPPLTPPRPQSVYSSVVVVTGTGTQGVDWDPPREVPRGSRLSVKVESVNEVTR